MAFQILLNALLAFTWMFMNDTYRAADFVSGFALGMIAIFMLRRFFPQRFTAMPFMRFSSSSSFLSESCFLLI